MYRGAAGRACVPAHELCECISKAMCMCVHGGVVVLVGLYVCASSPPMGGGTWHLLLHQRVAGCSQVTIPGTSPLKGLVD